MMLWQDLICFLAELLYFVESISPIIVWPQAV